MKFEKGDLVTPGPAFVGHKNIFIVEDVDLRDRSFKLRLFSDVTETRDNIPNPDIRWKEDELIMAEEKDCCIGGRTRRLVPTSEDVEKIKLSHNFLQTDYIKQTIDNLYPSVKVEPIKSNPWFDHWEVQENQIIKEENDMYKILEIYEGKERKKINEQYDERKQSIIEIDTIQTIIKEMEAQVRAVAGEKANGYCFEYPGLYEDRTKKALEELEQERDKKVKELRNKIIDIKALAELAPNYEEKLKILRDYEIMDKKKNIIL